MNYIKVKDVNHLRELLNEDKNDFFILLNGLLRSSKFITFGEEKDFCILNLADDTEQELTEQELFDEDLTNIGKAIRQGAFYCEY